MKKFWINIRMFIWMTLLTGVIYPLLITVIAQLTMKSKADGSLVTIKKAVIGSALIAQKFEAAKYFWARPSAVDYNPLPSGGSNLGPTSMALKKAVAERRENIVKAHRLTENDNIPAELLFASGSGLDPHITIPAAYFQLDRVARERGMDKEKVKQMIDGQRIRKPLGFLGEECVNVLLLNRNLDNQNG